MTKKQTIHPAIWAIITAEAMLNEKTQLLLGCAICPQQVEANTMLVGRTFAQAQTSIGTSTNFEGIEQHICEFGGIIELKATDDIVEKRYEINETETFNVVRNGKKNVIVTFRLSLNNFITVATAEDPLGALHELLPKVRVDTGTPITRTRSRRSVQRET